MKRALTIRQELTDIHTVKDLTEVFESIASLHIAKIRDRVVVSKSFFSELWQTYQGLRIDPSQQLARKRSGRMAARDVFVVITGEGKLSGESDERIVETMRAAFPGNDKADIIAIGSHGATTLRQFGLKVTQTFPLPLGDIDFSVTPITDVLNKYRNISVFYQTYESLRVQKVVYIELVSAIRELGEVVNQQDETIVSSRDFIFEPDVNKIADYMESVMLGVALIQVIMESKLAQYAGRYNAMNAAKHRAVDLVHDYRTAYYRAKRSEADERLKEIMKVVKHRGSNRGN